MISQLKSDVQNELSKNKKVSQLTETLNQLKRECDEQVEIATRSAQSQALVDYEFSLSKYKEELLDSQLSLKSVETSIASLTEQRNCVIEILHQKESEVDTAISMRNDRLEAYENELQEAEFQLEEAKRKLLESNQQKISLKDLQRKLDDENKKLSEISLKENEYIKMIDNKNEEISKLKEKISLLKHEVETYTQTLEQLPSINEWENAKIKLEHVRTSFNTESEKNNLQKTYSMNLKQFEKLKEKKKELELNNKNIKEKIEKEKYEINNFIDENNFENCSELISMLTKQKKSLKQKCDAIEYQISQMITNTSIQRKEKENFEKELSNLKRQISTFAMKDPESLKYEILDENDGESKRKRNITKRIQKTCEKNRIVRLVSIVYIVLLDVFLVLKFVRK
ncbi:hypothetical protein GPJ56_007641 [Histomonas meleagridis]|uniref:uncharacterized protein n=1 Tax=Histomonas meleagridis TaxID=135588 RepID=UPI00355ACAF5|nr:hypothetical protein GPJ56_007641 [Histomonas meleagridis]KAH0799444.1 hypothetical protein GO595_007845 [Histomonas meleagridis]